MADTDLIFGVVVQGAEDAAASLDNITKAEEQLAAAIQRQQAAGQMNQKQTQAAAAAVQKLSGMKRQQATVTNFLNSAVRQNNDVTSQNNSFLQMNATDALQAAIANKDLGFKISAVLNEGSEMLFMFGNLLPAGMNKFTMNLLMAGNNARKFTRGMGALGAGLAIVMGVLPGLIQLFSSTGDEIDDMADSADNATQSLQQLIAATRAAVQAERQLARVRREEGTAEEQAGFAASLRQDVGTARERLERQREALGIDQQILAGLEAQALEAARSGRDAATAVNRIVGEAVASQAISSEQQARNNVQYALTALVNLQVSAERAQRTAEQFERERVAGVSEEIEAEMMAEIDPTTFGAAPTTRRGGGGGGAAEAAEEEAERIREAKLAIVDAETNNFERLEAIRERERAAQTQHNALLKETERQRLEVLYEAEQERVRLANEQAEYLNELNEQLAALGSSFGNAFEDGIDRTIEAFTRLNQELEKQGRTTIDQTELMAQVVKSAYFDMAKETAAGASEAFGSAVQAAVSAEQPFADAIKAQTHEFIRGIVLRSTVAAVEQGALALAAAAMGNPVSAAAHGAAAAQYAAVAGVASAVGFAAGTFTPKREEVEEPDVERDKTNQRREETMVINVGTFPISTDADVGRAVQEALRAVERRDGR